MDKNKLNAIVTIIFLFTLLMSVVAGITTISNGESILGGGINTTTINANQVLVNGTAVSLTDTDTNTNVTSIQVTGTTTKTLNVEQTGLTNLTATWSDINTFNSSDDIQAVYYPTLSTYLNSSTAGTTYQPLEATLTDIADGTIVENLVNTANPWADNEVSDTLTASVLTDDNTYALVSGETFTGDILLNTGIDLNISTTGQINWNSSIYEYINASGCLIRVVGTTRVNQCP